MPRRQRAPVRTYHPCSACTRRTRANQPPVLVAGPVGAHGVDECAIADAITADHQLPQLLFRERRLQRTNVGRRCKRCADPVPSGVYVVGPHHATIRDSLVRVNRDAESACRSVAVQILDGQLSTFRGVGREQLAHLETNSRLDERTAAIAKEAAENCGRLVDNKTGVEGHPRQLHQSPNPRKSKRARLDSNQRPTA